MNKLVFFTSIAAAMGISYEELSEGRKRLVNDVYKDHLTVRGNAEEDNMMLSIGITEERFNELDAAISKAVNSKVGKPMATSFKDFTVEAENPIELFAMGIMFQKGISPDEDDIPDMIIEALESLKSKNK